MIRYCRGCGFHHWKEDRCSVQKRYAFLWRLPTAVAVTTALAQGGAVTSGGSVPLGATPIDEISLAVNVPAGGGTSFPIAAIPAGQIGGVTALGIDTPDAPNTRFTTRVDGAPVAPFNQESGSPGPTAAPTPLGTPVPLGPGQVFSLFVENVSGADFAVNVRIQGFTF